MYEVWGGYIHRHGQMCEGGLQTEQPGPAGRCVEGGGAAGDGGQLVGAETGRAGGQQTSLLHLRAMRDVAHILYLCK